jgi:hypothetical protein
MKTPIQLTRLLLRLREIVLPSLISVCVASLPVSGCKTAEKSELMATKAKARKSSFASFESYGCYNAKVVVDEEVDQDSRGSQMEALLGADQFCVRSVPETGESLFQFENDQGVIWKLAFKLVVTESERVNGKLSEFYSFSEAAVEGVEAIWKSSEKNGDILILKLNDEPNLITFKLSKPGTRPKT